MWCNFVDQVDDDDFSVINNIAAEMQYISTSNVRTFMQSEIEKIAQETNRPIAMFAVRELDDIDKGTNYFDNPQAITNDIGSEAICAHLIRNLSLQNKDQYLSHPKLDQMRKAQCHNICLLDDCSGSGKRLLKFLEHLEQHKSYRSLLNYKKLKITIICHSITEKAKSKLKKLPRQINIRHEIYSKTIDTIDLGVSKTKVKEILNKYGGRTKSTSMSRGYKKISSLTIYDYRCPNTVPSMFWSDGPSWNSLFTNRTPPSEMHSIFSSTNMLVRRGNYGKKLLLILSLLKENRAKLSNLSHSTGLNVTELNRNLLILRKFDFIDSNNFLTNRGRAELKNVSRNRYDIYLVPDLGQENYYPKKLRSLT